MLTIRKEQMDAISVRMRPIMVAPLVSHMNKYFPEHCLIFGDSEVRQTVELGLENASQYGLETEREVFLYVSLMFLLGSGFDTDFQLPWAGATLKKTDFPDTFTKINTVYKTAMSYLDRVIGKYEEEQTQVMRRVRELNLKRATEKVKRNFFLGVMNLLKEIHPRKAEDLGDEGLKKLITDGVASAMKYDIIQKQGRMVYILHMFILGSSFDTDPKFSWAQEILSYRKISKEGERIEDLHKAVVAHVSAFC